MIDTQAPKTETIGEDQVLAVDHVYTLAPEDAKYGCAIVMIGPEEATYLLSRNQSNRPFREWAVKNYVAATLRGEWQFNGEPVHLDKDGNVINGQHRLEKILRMMITEPVLLVWGLEPDAFDTYDQGVGRTIADSLEVDGEKNAGDLQGALRFLYGYDRFLASDDRRYNRIPMVTPRLAKALLAHYPEIRTSVDMVATHNSYTNGMVKRPVLSTAHYLFRRADQERADDFLERFVIGHGLDLGHPLLLLRDRLRRDKASHGTSMNRFDEFALILKAWNAFMEGKTIKSLRYRAGEATPTITGLPKFETFNQPEEEETEEV